MKWQFGNPEHIRLARLKDHQFMEALKGRHPGKDRDRECIGCRYWIFPSHVGRQTNGGCHLYQSITGQPGTIRPHDVACGGFK